VLACYGVPRMALIPVGGVLADKIGARTVMLAADAARCVLVAVLAGLATRHTTSLAVLGPIAAGIGAGEGLFIPASFTIMLTLLKTSRVLQVLLLVVIAANLAGGGMSEVALPSLAHAKFGAVGYGALLSCFAVGGVIGTLSAARTGGLRRPAIFASVVFLVEAAAIALTPYLGGEAGAAAMLFISGATNGLGNVTFLTVLQKWAPPALLGRVMAALMLCAFGSFPLSVVISGVLVRHIGPALFFPVAGGLVALAILGGLTQREFREFGAADRSGSDAGASAMAREERPVG
jgi:MFS family permease